MSAGASFRDGYVSADFLTRSYRISGDVRLRGEPLLDRLNDHMALFIELERMFVSPLLNPAVLTGNYDMGNVRKNILGMVVLAQADDALPRRRGQYEGRDHIARPVFIVTAGFEVRGDLRLHPTVDVANFIRTTPEQYIPIFDAEAVMTLESSVVYRGGALLVNREQIEVFSVEKRQRA
ncbi:MAG: hypothetical protein GYB65_17220 [Chloroflexi bacterium]|nr:hypothetical protein [Chloroflexota bacterium]